MDNQNTIQISLNIKIIAFEKCYNIILLNILTIFTN